MSGNARISVLTSRLVRLEWDTTGQFMDRASQAVWYREQPVPVFSVNRRHGILSLETEDLALDYTEGAHFSASSLRITVKATSSAWCYGDADPLNLQGTARTLDQVSGGTDLEPGLLSRSGWSVLDDSGSLVFGEDGWLVPRPAGQMDLYFLGYGHDYAACLGDFARIAGRVPLIPRWALGNWWSRYWPYSQDELMDVIREFEAHDVPLSVCVIDMDWHLTDVRQPDGIPAKGPSPGWTGYTWNRELYPDPDGLLAWLHGQGLRVSLNLHPADGVRAYEAAYPEMARRLGIEPSTGLPVAFDIADPAFAAAYLELLHHTEEERGVDLWWIDWQQERTSGIPGLDPLWWLNHLHFLDLGRDGISRPLILSRWAGLGSQRYPIGFSGDTKVTWESLAFQPTFTARAANVAYGWWSHDIGGHGGGTEDGELFARWVQFGVLSPVVRLHGSRNPFSERRPWGYDAEVERIASDAMRLRHALIPYLYSMAWRTHTTCESLVRPMYHGHPDAPEAYDCPQQYLFGTELLAAPFAEPAAAGTGLARQRVWLPEGDWYGFFDGSRIAGGREVTVHGGLRDIPLYARAGAIVPLSAHREWGRAGNPDALDIHLFPGADGSFELYEDDGATVGYLESRHAITQIAHRWTEPEWEITIGRPVGDAAQTPATRSVRLLLRGISSPAAVGATVGGWAVDPPVTHDERTRTVTVGPITVPRGDDAGVRLIGGTGSLRADADRTAEAWFEMLKAFRLPALIKRAIHRELAAIKADPGVLDRWAGSLSAGQRQALLDLLDLWRTHP